MANHYNLAFVKDTGTRRYPPKPDAMPPAEYQKMYPDALRVFYAPSVDAEGMWSGKKPLPKIGDKVTINFNQLGSGIVENYFIENEYLGVRVRLDNQPEWHRKQNPGRNYALVFGLEIDPVDFGKQQRSAQPLYPHVPKGRQPQFPHETASPQNQTFMIIECMYCHKYMGEKPRHGVTLPKTTASICRQCWAARWPEIPYPEDEKEERHDLRRRLPQTNVVTVTCPICRKVIEIPEYNSITRTEALGKHLKEEHPTHPMLLQVTIEGGEPVPPQYRHLTGWVSEPLPKEAE